jgi:hypothetical protein
MIPHLLMDSFGDKKAWRSSSDRLRSDGRQTTSAKPSDAVGSTPLIRIMERSIGVEHA